MASLQTSIAAFYATLNAANFPGSTLTLLRFSRAPQTKSDSSQLDVSQGYVIWTLQSVGEEQLFESDLETYRLTFTARMSLSPANTTPDPTNAIISAIRFNGQAPSAAGGFENRSTLPGLTEVSLIGIFPEGPPETIQEPSLDKGGYTTFTTTMRYRVQVERA